jgi:hypothetical protein
MHSKINDIKNLFYFTMALLLIASCKTKTESQSSPDELSMNGVFAKGIDTLKIEIGMEGTIDFDISASNEVVQAFVFNAAELFECGDDFDMFKFKDSSEYTYEDLIFTYTTNKDNRSVVHSI